uniref:Uncharacterized protein n=1 Tax=Arundo donax TaxID=35708 RepID=A0A0A9H3H6_ARUDO
MVLGILDCPISPACPYTFICTIAYFWYSSLVAFGTFHSVTYSPTKVSGPFCVVTVVSSPEKLLLMKSMFCCTVKLLNMLKTV